MKIPFGCTSDGKEANLYFIGTSKLTAGITDYGGAVVSLELKDKDGKLRDVALGYDCVRGYQENTYYFGAIIGRNCNRIKDGTFKLDGTVYRLEQNDGKNNLHSGNAGFHRYVWTVKEHTDRSITMYLHSPHLEQGFPGNLLISVKYTVTDEEELMIEYDGEADRKTVLNVTNHTYFNLGGHDSRDILNHSFMISASQYTPVDEGFIPDGTAVDVSGTPMDLRRAAILNDCFDKSYTQLDLAGGYDHNYALDRKCEYDAEVCCCHTGITMKVKTDLPGIQFYTGNSIGEHCGKNGTKYGKHKGFCLETQYFPNSVNISEFASPVIEEGIPYRHFTSYKFEVSS